MNMPAWRSLAHMTAPGEPHFAQVAGRAAAMPACTNRCDGGSESFVK
jgi:hypothetical protein